MLTAHAGSRIGDAVVDDHVLWIIASAWERAIGAGLAVLAVTVALVSRMLAAVGHLDLWPAVRIRDRVVPDDERGAGGRRAHVSAHSLARCTTRMLSTLQLRLLRVQDHRRRQVLNHLELLLGQCSLLCSCIY